MVTLDVHTEIDKHTQRLKKKYAKLQKKENLREFVVIISSNYHNLFVKALDIFTKMPANYTPQNN